MGEVENIETESQLNTVLTTNRGVVIDFYADWCGPCKMIGPLIEKLVPKYEKLKFIKVNVDAASDIAEKYEINAMPTFLAFLDNKKEAEVVGASEQKIKEMIENLAKKLE